MTKTSRRKPAVRSALVQNMPSGQTRLGATANLAADGVTGNTIAILEWSKGLYGDIDVTSLQRSVVESTRRVAGGDLSGAEALLMSQVMTLNAIFVTLARRAQANESVSQFQVNLRLALKAQGQCRATVETLALIKNPPVFAKQANITSGPQQVNNAPVVNGPQQHARVKNVETEPNKLLEGNCERVDGNEKAAAKAGDPALASVGKVDRPTNTGRQGAFIPQRVSRRIPASPS
jgi:hypothetical protein